MRKTKEKYKYLQKRGTGEGEAYKPWITVGEIGSCGTSSRIKDWKNGRTINCLSQAEANVYYFLRFDENVADIREQYPLDLKETIEIATALGVNHPAHDGNLVTMTTDFLVTYKDKTEVAYNVKANSSIKSNRRYIEKINIEKIYWEKRNVELKIIFKDDLNDSLINNIRFASPYYNLSSQANPDNITILKHLIIRKEINIDLNQRLNYLNLINIYRKEIDEWKRLNKAAN